MTQEPSPSLDRPEAAPSGPDPALTPPPPEKDELADFAAAAAEVMAGVGMAGPEGGSGEVEGTGDGTAGKPGTDPFSVAARASLPDAWSGGAPASAPPAPRSAPPPPAPARPTPQRSALRGPPIVIIGLGLAALIGITAFALLGRGGSPPPAVPAVAPGPPAPTPPGPEASPPAPEPAAATPAEPVQEPEPRPPERKPEPRARPPDRKLEKRMEAKPAERKAEPARAPPAPAPDAAAESRDPEQGEVTGLSRDEVNKVVSANRKAFNACIASAAGSDVKLDGRPVALRITINTNGTVTYPTLDEPALNSTEMGQCLKSAARLMAFPKFKGEPFQHDVPLALAGD